MLYDQEVDDLDEIEDAEEQDGEAQTTEESVVPLRGKFKIRTLKKAVDFFCRDCNGEKHGGKFYDCLDHDCVFYPWKKGKSVYDSGKQPGKDHLEWLEKHGTGVLVSRTVTPEQIAKMRAGLEKASETAEAPRLTEKEQDTVKTSPASTVGSWRQRSPK